MSRVILQHISQLQCFLCVVLAALRPVCCYRSVE